MLTVANGAGTRSGAAAGSAERLVGPPAHSLTPAPSLSPSSRASAAIVRWAQPPGPHKGSGYPELAPETSRGVSLLQLDQGEAGGVWGGEEGTKMGCGNGQQLNILGFSARAGTFYMMIRRWNR